jgi:hypothetical protein
MTSASLDSETQNYLPITTTVDKYEFERLTMSNVLFLSGFNEVQDTLMSLSYNQGCLRLALQSSNWRVEQANVENEASVRNAYNLFDDNDPLLVIYTGHGEGQLLYYPKICPIDTPFDLLHITRGGATSFIFDCCNALDTNHLHNHKLPGILPFFNTTCLDPTQRYILCMRQQVLGFTNKKGTELNLGMCGVMARWNCTNILHFCILLNGYCIVEYKNKNYLRNKRVHSILTLNGCNVPRPRNFQESDIHQQVPKIIWPEFKFPAVHTLGSGRSLMNHLGEGGIGFDMPDDEDVAEVDLGEDEVTPAHALAEETKESIDNDL